MRNNKSKAGVIYFGVRQKSQTQDSKAIKHSCQDYTESYWAMGVITLIASLFFTLYYIEKQEKLAHEKDKNVVQIQSKK